jgi:hypothetical protein
MWVRLTSFNITIYIFYVIHVDFFYEFFGLYLDVQIGVFFNKKIMHVW